jgi:hypothetical protein
MDCEFHKSEKNICEKKWSKYRDLWHKSRFFDVIFEVFAKRHPKNERWENVGLTGHDNQLDRHFPPKPRGIF